MLRENAALRDRVAPNRLSAYGYSPIMRWLCVKVLYATSGHTGECLLTPILKMVITAGFMTPAMLQNRQILKILHV